jgi:hypothetical protein
MLEAATGVRRDVPDLFVAQQTWTQNIVQREVFQKLSGNGNPGVSKDVLESRIPVTIAGAITPFHPRKCARLFTYLVSQWNLNFSNGSTDFAVLAVVVALVLVQSL